MVAISRTEVNHDGCGRTAPDDMIWDNGSVIKPRASSLQVIVDHASLPGLPNLPYSAILLEFSSFLATSRWPRALLI